VDGLKEDPAISWGRQNPQLAGRCIEPPVIVPPLSSIEKCFNTFEDYWQWRRWIFPVMDNDKEALHSAKAMATHVLTHPLTVASSAHLMLKHLLPLKNNQEESTLIRWCCLGARAESQLPSVQWKEMLVFMDNVFVDPLQISLEFIGPDLASLHPRVLITNEKIFEDNKPTKSILELQWMHKGTYHSYLAQREELDRVVQFDGFILLNPGFSHPHLRQDWKPTLDLLLGHGVRSPILLTAHSAQDAARETEYLKIEYGIDVDYRCNPFSSRIQFQDPFESGHTVSPNARVAVIPAESSVATE
jgi:hypothetical protein